VARSPTELSKTPSQFCYPRLSIGIRTAGGDGDQLSA